MAPPIYTDQVIRVAFQGDVGTREWSNIMHYKYSGSAPSPSDLTAMGDVLAAAWALYMTPLQDADTSLVSVKLTDLTSAFSAQVDDPAVTPGTRAGNYLPASASVLITYDVDFRYRGGHPRNYLSVGVQGDLNTAQQWEGTFVTTATTAWNDTINGPVGNTYGSTAIASLGMVSLRTGGSPRGAGLYVPYSGSVGFGQVALGTIKRRLRPRG